METTPISTITLSFDIGIKNLSCCVLKISNDSFQIIDWSILPIVEESAKADSKSVSLEALSFRLFEQLDDLIARILTNDTDHIEYVLLENQPCLKNPVMKSVQMMIYTYFMMRKYNMGTVGQVNMVAANGKNNAKYHKNCVLPPQPKASMRPYDLRKWQSVQYARYYLRDAPELLEQFESNKKKDDMADTLNQAVVWHRRNKLYDESFENLINLVSVAE